MRVGRKWGPRLVPYTFRMWAFTRFNRNVCFRTVTAYWLELSLSPIKSSMISVRGIHVITIHTNWLDEGKIDYDFD